MNKSTQQNMTDSQLDQLLENLGEAPLPEHFTHNVMASIGALPQAQQNEVVWWQWAALIGGGIPAFLQTVAFIFSAWNIATIG